jgi:hypothetical protein
MELLVQRARAGSRFAYGAVGYWGLNAVLAAAELRWHLLYRITLWDMAQIRTLAPVLTKLVHH